MTELLDTDTFIGAIKLSGDKYHNQFSESQNRQINKFCLDGICSIFTGDIIKDIINFIKKNKCPLDIIVSSTKFTTIEKLIIVKQLIYITNIQNPTWNLGISANTISKLFQHKEETYEFLELFTTIITYSIRKETTIFGYIHLYQLVLQLWMDVSKNYLSIDFRKNLISIGFNNYLPSVILHEIKCNIEIWFNNLGKNQDITELIEWLCIFDHTGNIACIKTSYEKKKKESFDKEKEFKKMHNMSMEEYKRQQQNAKINGICKYIRQNTSCPHATRCIFYHGKLEETYGIQPCRYGITCKHLHIGECKFLHKPSLNQLSKVHAFYSMLSRKGNLFLTTKEKYRYVDNEIRNNPYVILEKLKTDTFDIITYRIPTCTHDIDIYGAKQKCGNKVLFMTKLGSQLKFYCCYEHMYADYPNVSYVVKQNILDEIFNI